MSSDVAPCEEEMKSKKRSNTHQKNFFFCAMSYVPNPWYYVQSAVLSLMGKYKIPVAKFTEQHYLIKTT